ncbi:Uma2 family endonuclease [Lacrimispora sp.]|uniref:Uma2 family endonuclease n=1 Tax=Lacrimispora sp. TaxID=2719234 RepID=UPI0028B0CF89|nr:Uma2 family endonuclease [Lacrimispora sp.]
MPLPKDRLYTIDDIYNIPDGTRAELIDGQMYMMAPPSTIHQRLVMKISYSIQEYINKNNGPCEVFPAPFAVFLNDDEKTYVEPDISVICDKNKIDDRGCVGAPDWIIEIVSPGSKRMDYYTKLALYRAAGVREYWIVDPLRKTILIYDMEHDDGPVLYSFTDKIKVNIYDNLYIDFMDIIKAIDS